MWVNWVGVSRNLWQYSFSKARAFLLKDESYSVFCKENSLLSGIVTVPVFLTLSFLYFYSLATPETSREIIVIWTPNEYKKQVGLIVSRELQSYTDARPERFSFVNADHSSLKFNRSNDEYRQAKVLHF